MSRTPRPSDTMIAVAEHWAAERPAMQPGSPTITMLGAGTANEVAAVELDGGERVIVKLSPADATGLTYERSLMATEALALRILGRAEVPQPEIVFEATLDGRDALVMTELTGRPANSTETVPLARDVLGRTLARLHEAGRTPFHVEPGDVDVPAESASTSPSTGLTEGNRHGYPFRPELQAASARDAYRLLVEAVLTDAARFEVDLPVAADEIRHLIDTASPAFDSVTEPTLVHFDLWEGNLLVMPEHGAEAAQLTGVIDHERAHWADPTADLVSLALFTDVPETVAADTELLRAYRETSGRELLPDEDARTRARLWSLYLALVMVVEGIPRGYEGDWFDEHDASVRTWIGDITASLA
ncbi:aminoglycoside phosphotransferase family protein [Plantibacter sp. ME-Dv--P-122b]|uniref:phosphotransferase family protein n=1 Tax=Plantibacter sp. ME-Dv--P-122b TaxID=3040300 RepID=UPI00254CCA1E|nr:aminoglycoside phosphotransferase family protein [Plantibacter sp. ME-Dv--P-122b]